MRTKPIAAGDRFGDWRVLGRAPTLAATRHTYWRCRCLCGEVHAVRGSFLRRKESRSCRLCAIAEVNHYRRYAPTIASMARAAGVPEATVRSRLLRGIPLEQALQRRSA